MEQEESTTLRRRSDVFIYQWIHNRYLSWILLNFQFACSWTFLVLWHRDTFNIISSICFAKSEVFVYAFQHNPAKWQTNIKWWAGKPLNTEKISAALRVRWSEILKLFCHKKKTIFKSFRCLLSPNLRFKCERF
jgi:hypothetical protein